MSRELTLMRDLTLAEITDRIRAQAPVQIGLRQHRVIVDPQTGKRRLGVPCDDLAEVAEGLTAVVAAVSFYRGSAVPSWPDFVVVADLDEPEKSGSVPAMLRRLAKFLEEDGTFDDSWLDEDEPWRPGDVVRHSQGGYAVVNDQGMAIREAWALEDEMPEIVHTEEPS